MDSSPSDANAASISQLTHLGDYHLKELLSQTPEKRTWLAEQLSIRRLVVIEELIDHRPHLHEAFFARARAMASVDFPKIGTVLEAVDQPALSYCAYELLPGTSLTELQLSGQALQAISLTAILQQVAEANLHLEKSGHATTSLTPGDIHVEESGVVRLKNLAIPGPRNPEQSVRDITHLGEALRDLVAKDWPGTNRVLTLLGWMRGEGIEAPLTWDQVRATCHEITTQLSDAASPQRVPFRLPPIVVRLIPAVALIVILGIAALSWQLLPKRTPKPQRVALPPPITLAAGTYSTPDGLQQSLSAVTLDGHLVTIGEYRDFLNILDILAKTGDHKLFDHPEQPDSKTSHQPAGWAALLLQLKSTNDPLQDQPVTGIDWWDAQAYAKSKKSRLPTQEEIFAALAKKPPGSVFEWTEFPAADPANPLGEKLWVVFSNGKPRQWVKDRSTRRADVGFRVVK